jgi:hypothetical protein
MYKAFRVTVMTAAIGIAGLSLTAPAHAGDGSAVGAGARRIWCRRYLRKRTHTASGVCRSTTAAYILSAATAAGLLRGGGLWTSISVRLLQVPSPLTSLAWSSAHFCFGSVD